MLLVLQKQPFSPHRECIMPCTAAIRDAVEAARQSGGLADVVPCTALSSHLVWAQAHLLQDLQHTVHVALAILCWRQSARCRTLMDVACSQCPGT